MRYVFITLIIINTLISLGTTQEPNIASISESGYSKVNMFDIYDLSIDFIWSFCYVLYNIIILIFKAIYMISVYNLLVFLRIRHIVK